MEKDFNSNYMPPFMDYGIPPNGNMNLGMEDPMFNPMMQYEQGYCYYRYLCMQMEYKLKCKEYERMCNSDNRPSIDRRERKVE